MLLDLSLSSATNCLFASLPLSLAGCFNEVHAVVGIFKYCWNKCGVDLYFPVLTLGEFAFLHKYLMEQAEVAIGTWSKTDVLHFKSLTCAY